MNRRAFLARLLGGAATVAVAATLDPEMLLWRPEAKTIFIPKAIEAPTLAFHAKAFDMHYWRADVELELSDLTLKMEGQPGGWRMVYRDEKSGLFVPADFTVSERTPV